MLPRKFQNLANSLAQLPGIGISQAQRWALFLYNRNPELNQNLIESIKDLKDIKLCSKCFSLSEKDLCDLCSSQQRQETTLCIVANPLDVVLLERTNKFSGKYFVLGNLIDPLSGIGPEKVRFKELKLRLEKNNIEEIILAFNQNIQADQTKLYLKELIPSNLKITELAKGLPRGGDLDYIDQETLGQAISNRRTI